MTYHNELDGVQYWRFIGKDGSLGYRTGTVYRLFVNHYLNKQDDGSFRIGKIVIQRTLLQRLLHGVGICPYDSRKLFDENWERV